MESAGQYAGFEFNKDPNSGNMLGLSWAQINQGVSVMLHGYIHLYAAPAHFVVKSLPTHL